MLIHAIVKVLFGHYREMYKFAIGTVMFMMSIFVDYLDTDACTRIWLFTHAKKIFLNRGQCTNPMKRRLAFNEWTAEKFAKSMIESIIWAKVCGNVQMKVSLLNILCKTCQISEIDHLLEVFAWISCVFYVFWANFNKVCYEICLLVLIFCMFSLLTAWIRC